MKWDGSWEGGLLGTMSSKTIANLTLKKPNRNSHGGCPAVEELPRAPGEMIRSGVFQKELFNSPLGEIITRGCRNPWITVLESSPCTNCLKQASLCI